MTGGHAAGGWELHLWQPELSPHLLPLYRALRNRREVQSATFIYDRKLDVAREKLGWSVELEPQDRLVHPRSESQVEELVAGSRADSVHIFGGMHWVPSIVHGLRMCIKHKRRFGLMHEPRVLEGWKGKLRLAHSWASEGDLRKHAGFVLAVGRHGPGWFWLTGFRRDRIFDFAYFLPAPVAQRRSRAAVPQIGFVGRLEREKGFHLFLSATEHMKTVADVHVFGAGTLAALARQRLNGLGEWGHFHGPVPMREVAGWLEELDVLVLPSITTNDGWGAVISEALMAGTAVVCSDRVGASMCIAEPGLGEVVRGMSPQGLAAAIDKVLSSDLGEASRQRRRDWALPRLSQEGGADYLLRILDHVYSGGRRPESFVA
ncbi:glycosyltransferase family 4 protein [Devosia rhizoryzae]|uniref:Glycosyltransferase family 4 protein n=1 Tax=Devosia rhizoryzae TaxID=2774137 RepID=A0ABX7CAT3_9HYPH|nr:glycosyltransferase family 4 protein [Devosia rhizoryzae]QQR40379.1 glycosyltransferase family 4 protein [Devosia rhizoryzae]